jgi:hypothetical protein
VWLDNVPASQQPAPTDCATAIKNRPLTAHVLFGNLKDEAAKAPPKMTPAPSMQRTANWPARPNEPPHRFDTSPGIPNHPLNANETSGVRTVNATTLAPRPPTSDTGIKVRRPER